MSRSTARIFRGQELDLDPELTRAAMRVLVINCAAPRSSTSSSRARRRTRSARRRDAGDYRGTVPQSSGRWRRSPRRPQSSPIAWCMAAAVCRGRRHRPGGAAGAPGGYPRWRHCTTVRRSRGSKRRCAPEFRWSRHWIPRFTPTFHPGPGAMQSPSSRACVGTISWLVPPLRHRALRGLDRLARPTIVTLHLGAAAPPPR